MFRQEALRLKQLGQHPQIPDLYNYLEENDRQYLVQEFVDGQNLAQELEAGQFSPAQIGQLLVELLPLLNYIHQHQVIHRDIKPANIIRCRRTQKLFLVDLGAAKVATGTALALTGTVIGSAEYTAPEQSRGKAVFASDIYSLGATCLHLLTGMSPFDLYDDSEGRWVWQTVVGGAISPALVRILDKMVAGPTNRRYASVQEVWIDLRLVQFAQQRPAPVRPELETQRMQQPAWLDPPLDLKESVTVQPAGKLMAKDSPDVSQKPVAQRFTFDFTHSILLGTAVVTGWLFSLILWSAVMRTSDPTWTSNPPIIYRIDPIH